MGNRSPALARTAEDGGRYYLWKGEPYWSSTTIIGGGVPKFLHAHYAKMAAELAFEAIFERGPYSRPGAIARRMAARAREYLLERQAEGLLRSLKVEKMTTEELALRWLKGAAERHRDVAAERGSDVHAAAEEHVLALARETSSAIAENAIEGPAWPEELDAYRSSFSAWMTDWQPEYLAAEATVFNRTQSYAGTLDAIARLDAQRLARRIAESGSIVWPRLRDRAEAGEPFTGLIDYKAGNRIYPEVGLQLASYEHGEFIGLPNGIEAPLPPIDGALCLHLTPTGYHLYPVDTSEPVFNAFLFAAEVFRFRQEIAPSVLGRDLAPTKATVAA